MAEVSFEARRGGGVGDNGCPNPLPHPPQDTRGRGEEESRGRKERNKGGEERRGLKTLTRRYPATQGRRILREINTMKTMIPARGHQTVLFSEHVDSRTNSY